MSKVRRNESRVIINVTEKCRTLFNDEVYFFPGSHVQKLIVYMGNAAFYKNAYTHLVTDAVINLAASIEVKTNRQFCLPIVLMKIHYQI